MTIERKKKKLATYRQLNERIENLRREKEKWYFDNWYHGTGLGSGPRNTSADGKGVELTAEKAEKISKQIDREIERLYELRMKIEQAINALEDPTEQRVIRMLYIGEIDVCGNKEWYDVDNIAYKLGYSERHIYRIWKSALQHLPDF